MQTATNSLSFSLVEWLSSDRIRNGASDPTFAELKIMLGDRCVTRVEDFASQSVRQSIRISLESLGEWFASNWWRLRYEPSLEAPLEQQTDWRLVHNLKAAGDGFFWPSLQISGDDDVVHAALLRDDTGNPKVATIRYLEQFRDRTVDAASYERAVDELLDLTLARYDSVGPRGAVSQLGELWRETLEERADASKTRFRKFEAMLGYDAGEAPDNVVENVIHATTRIGNSAAGEIASQAKSSVASILDYLKLAIVATPLVCDTLPLLEIRKSLSSNAASMLPWAIGRECAQHARAFWNVKQGPISNQTLGKIFSIDERYLVDGGTVPAEFRLGLGLFDPHEMGKLRVTLSALRPEGRRFEFSRVLGDAMNVRFDDSWRPVTKMKTRRQQIQRSFAAEFLCPAQDLMEYFSGRKISDIGESDIDDAAQAFDVSSVVIRRQFENYLDGRG